jgi:hypothetical protein
MPTPKPLYNVHPVGRPLPDFKLANATFEGLIAQKMQQMDEYGYDIVTVFPISDDTGATEAAMIVGKLRNAKSSPEQQLPS